jgi:hypothetical protein
MRRALPKSEIVGLWLFPSVGVLRFRFMGWTEVVTALGTAGAAIAAVGIALWSGRQAKRRIDEERQRSHIREQLTQAYAVQVVQGERAAPGQPPSDPSALVLVAIVVNKGSYTITDVEVRFSLDGQDIVRAVRNQRMWSFKDVPKTLHKHGDKAEERAMEGILPPWDAGMRSESAEVPVQHLKAHHALVRWTDEWGQCWEHRLGKMKKIRTDQPWEP